ncbi:autotransporter domain-containing protein [Rhizobium sp. CSW-27]|uniref:autotransporter domain-containing protein n=1 Tax=Rhizobium sp. CSW-27 TaxID=2839985 RepID=UPI001C018F01|nr:autotransporter domain-containing protein [Rhizobium sp. CSW-27]MBT9368562.1 autotransporter domain-containing protein [Rhizobium sp. CSW-27]
MKKLYCTSALGLVFAMAACSLTPVRAADFSVASGNSLTTAQSLSGTQTGTVASGGTLSNSGTAVTLGAATGSGTTLTNDGTITSTGGRAIDTSSATGVITVTNTGRITSSNDAFRINNSLANGTLTLTNTGTISSSTGQALDFDKATSTTASITIANSGTIEASATDAVRLGGGTISLTNSGTIQSTSSGSRAIKFDTAATLENLVSLTITNQSGGTITALGDGIKIAGNSTSTSAAVISIDNAGTLSSTGDGQAVDLGDLVSTNLAITITNRATGVISASDNDAIKAGMNTTVENYGQITANYTSTSADDQNYDGVKFDGASGTVNNYAGASISGSYHGVKASGLSDDITVNNWGTIEGRNGSGVNSNGTGTVTNYGTITGQYDDAASFGDGDGIDIDHIGTITNYGTIQALGSKGTKPGETNPSTSEGIAIGGGTITNGSATVRTAGISGANNGILADDSNSGSIFGALTITNYGTIEGLNGYGIRIVNDAGYSNTIINYGTITGTTYAVSMGNGDDLFVYQAGSSVTGAVMGDGGSDTLRLGSGTGSFDLSLLGDTATYQGFETLDFTAGSVWTLSGTSSFSGATTVTSAVLDLDDVSLAGSTLVVSGSDAVLKGTGTVGSTTIGSAATLAPGHSIGTLSVSGNLTLASGSVYQVETNAAGQSDTVSVSGTATIENGASVEVRAENGTDDGSTYRANTTYTILTSSGLTGTFSSIDENFAYLSAALSYDASNAYLTLSREKLVVFADLAVTGNQKAVASVIDAQGSGDLYDAVLILPVGAPGNAFDQLSGEVHTALDNAMLARSGMTRGTIGNRIQSAFGGVASRSAGSTVTAYGEDGLDPFATFSIDERPTTFWMNGFGRWSHADGGATAADSDVRGGGFLVGADRLFEDGWRFGVAAGYGADRVETSGVDARADSDNYHLAIYGGQQLGPLGLRFGAAYSRSAISSHRSVGFSGFTDQLSADYDANTYQVFGEAAWRIDHDLVHVEPYANVAYVRVDRDAFRETGGAAALSVSGAQEDQVQTTLGARIDYDIAVSGTLGKLYAGAGWRHVFGDVSSTATQSFATGSSFRVTSAATDRDALLVDAGVSFELARDASFSLGYSGSFSGSDRDHQVSGTLGLRF